MKRIWLRRLLAFLMAPLVGSAAFSFVYTVKSIQVPLYDYPVEYYSVFATNWLGATAIGGAIMYILTVALVLPPYVVLVWKNRFSLKAMLLVGLLAGTIPFLWSSMVDQRFSDGLMLACTYGGLAGLLSSFVFYKIHGEIRAKPES